MAEISASTVMALRKMSGQGMMDCKKALGEADGDVDKAMAILRKKGLATMAKRAGRLTSEGIVTTKKSDDGKIAILATLCCETDFVSKGDVFVEAAGKLADYAMACQKEDGAENILETTVGDVKFSDLLTEVVGKTGEKTEVGDYARFKLDGNGLISVYVHFNKKVGAMVEAEASDESVAGSAELKEVMGDIAMHVVAINPMAIDASGIDPELIESEKAIYADQVKNKPANIVEKIIEGKLNKFLADKCLLAQPFVKDDSMTVAETVAQAAKKAGGQASIKRFVRFDVG